MRKQLKKSRLGKGLAGDVPDSPDNDATQLHRTNSKREQMDLALWLRKAAKTLRPSDRAQLDYVFGPDRFRRKFDDDVAHGLRQKTKIQGTGIGSGLPKLIRETALGHIKITGEAFAQCEERLRSLDPSFPFPTWDEARRGVLPDLSSYNPSTNSGHIQERGTIDHASRDMRYVDGIRSEKASSVDFDAEANTVAKSILPQYAIDRPSTLRPSRMDHLQAERDYQALIRGARYDRALAVAQAALTTSRATKDNRWSAHWTDRIADIYRAIGHLTDSAKYYEAALGLCDRALQDAPEDPTLEFLSLKSRFGLTMVNTYLFRGDLYGAYNEFDSILTRSDRLLTSSVSNSLGQQIRRSQIHLSRQKAEMLRLTGDYALACSLFCQVEKAYHETAVLERSYSSLGEADCLRLLGDTERSLDIYSGIEERARHMHNDLLLMTTLRRKGAAFQSIGNHSLAEVCFGEVRSLMGNTEQKYRFATIYSYLASASLLDNDCDKALMMIENVTSEFGLGRSRYALEYAHSQLCKAEILRINGDSNKSLALFHDAYTVYSGSGMAWGISRSCVGMTLCGDNTLATLMDNSKLQGLDLALYNQRLSPDQITSGVLMHNLP